MNIFTAIIFLITGLTYIFSKAFITRNTNEKFVKLVCWIYFFVRIVLVLCVSHYIAVILF